jgi:type I restriction enzyme R subunit
LRKLKLLSHPTLTENNRAFHRLLVEGIDVEFRNREGQITHDKVWLIDFKNPEANEFFAVNQFTVEENQFNRRADVVVFINGIPLAVLELKNIADEQATIRKAFDQLQTYKLQIPSLFNSNALLVISDGHDARLGTITSDWERFMSWRTITGQELMPPGSLQLETLLKGVFEKSRLLDYEARLAKIDLKPEERPKIDPNFEEITEDAEESTKDSLRRKWAQLEAMVGTEKRLALVAEDLVKHWEARYAAMEGKAMIVCMSRRICVDLYEAIRKLRPEWHHDDDDKGAMKIVMSGSASDKLAWQPHIRSKARREELAKRFKDPKPPFRIVIVRDMWLTGFDAPSLHTMYLDKPMRGHNLMQAIARVNRVFKDKPGGLVVDYLGLAEELQLALRDYTNSHGKGRIKIDQEEAVMIMLEKYEQVCGILHGFNYLAAAIASPAKRLHQIGLAANHVLEQENGKPRYLQGVMELSKAFALSVPHEKAMAIVDQVGFFQEVRAVLSKNVNGGHGQKSAEELDIAIRQIVSRAISSDQVIDIFDAAGLKKPDISILSDEFLADVQHLPQRNLAVELLQKLLNNELKVRSRKYLIQSRSFADMLESTIRRYQNRSIEAAQVIAELIELAKKMREGQQRGEQLGLTDDEVAFYDALEVNDSAVKVLGEPTLKTIARELVSHVRKSVTIDWTLRESAQAQIRVLVRRILRKYGYPPDKQEHATQTVLEQAKLLCADWAA